MAFAGLSKKRAAPRAPVPGWNGGELARFCLVVAMRPQSAP
jgi:hypothetical protein